MRSKFRETGCTILTDCAVSGSRWLGYVRKTMRHLITLLCSLVSFYFNHISVKAINQLMKYASLALHLYHLRSGYTAFEEEEIKRHFSQYLEYGILQAKKTFGKMNPKVTKLVSFQHILIVCTASSFSMPLWSSQSVAFYIRPCIK